MKSLAARLYRFFCSWRFLKIILWTATIMVLFYAEEDWRGPRVWAATKAKWEARGEVLDYATFQPPPVPDSQNLGAISLFQSAPVKDWRGHLIRAWPTLRQALGVGTYNNDFLSAGNWMRGDPPDLKKIAARIATEYAARLKTPPTSPDALVQFETLCPFISDLRRESTARPLCRFNTEDGADFPVERSYQFPSLQVLLSKYLVIDALLQLDRGQADLALADLRVIAALRSGVARDPSLVSVGFATAMTSIMNGGVHAGLLTHAWSDAQLAELQQIESSLNFLSLYHFTMRAEAAEAIVETPLMESFLGRRWYVAWVEQATNGSLPWWFAGNPSSVFLWPRGWFQIDLANTVNAIFDQMPVVDLAAQKVNLEIGKQLREKMGGPAALRPWSVRSISLYHSDYVYTFALGQTWSDEARIACALERYWLVHRANPPTLEALAPAQIASIPNDVMSGQPFHFQVRSNGSYLIYSTGWLLKDEGGKFTPSDDGSIFSQKSNWTWLSSKV